MASHWRSKIDLNQLREELFGPRRKNDTNHAQQSNHFAAQSQNRSTVVQQTNCWFYVWQVVKKASFEGKRVLFASDVDDTILRIVDPKWREAVFEQYGRYPPAVKIHHDGINVVMKDFIQDNNVDVIVITKRSASRQEDTYGELLGCGIDLVSENNEIEFSASELSGATKYLTRSQRVWHKNIISTSAESKGDYLVDFLNLKKPHNNYDVIFFIDNKIENIENVLDSVESHTTEIDITGFLYGSHPSKCFTPHKLAPM